MYKIVEKNAEATMINAGVGGDELEKMLIFGLKIAIAQHNKRDRKRNGSHFAASADIINVEKKIECQIDGERYVAQEVRMALMNALEQRQKHSKINKHKIKGGNFKLLLKRRLTKLHHLCLCARQAVRREFA